VLMRTPGHPGFSLLDLHDYPGQGTALIGPLDPFWDSKGFIEPWQFTSFCGPTVPLLRLPKRVLHERRNVPRHGGHRPFRSERPIRRQTAVEHPG